MVYTVYDFVKPTKLAAISRSVLCLCCTFQPNKEAVAHLGKQAKLKPQARGEMFVCLCVQCLCFQFVHVLYDLFVLVFMRVGMFVHVYTRCLCANMRLHECSLDCILLLSSQTQNIPPLWKAIPSLEAGT